MMILDNVFEFKQIVYLITDEEQKPRIVTAIQVNPPNEIIYKLANCTTETWHFDFEISEEKSVLVD